MAVTRPYRGVSADDRRAERRERLIEAALDVAGDDGVAAVTMKAVCARAGLTERYYYESFGGRAHLLAAIVEPAMEEIRDRVLAAIAATPPDLFERSRACAAAIVGVLTDDPRQARIFIEAPADDTLRPRHTAAVKAYAALVAEQMRLVLDLGPAAVGRLELASLVVVGGTTQAIAGWLDGSIDLAREDVVDEIARLCVAAAETVRDTS